MAFRIRTGKPRHTGIRLCGALHSGHLQAPAAGVQRSEALADEALRQPPTIPVVLDTMDGWYRNFARTGTRERPTVWTGATPGRAARPGAILAWRSESVGAAVLQEFCNMSDISSADTHSPAWH